MSTALVKPLPKADALERLNERYAKLQGRDLEVVAGMNRFAELPSFVEETARAELVALLSEGSDEAIRLKYGFKGKRELRLALYGTLPKKDWPAAMQAAHERVLARSRKAAGDKKGTTFNLNLISMPAPVKARDDEKVITVKAEEPPK